MRTEEGTVQGLTRMRRSQTWVQASDTSFGFLRDNPQATYLGKREYEQLTFLVRATYNDYYTSYFTTALLKIRTSFTLVYLST
jgi:hypothetical protein